MSPSDISVVVQGPIETQLTADGSPLTQAVCRSLRRHLPGAEIIISTWEGSDVTGLDCDQVVLSPDPGRIPGRMAVIGNVNRQLVSTREGLRRATRPYAMKFRADVQLLSADFLDTYQRDAIPRTTPLNLFSRRMIVFTSGHPDRMSPSRCFHLSDCILFGATEDQFKVWLNPLFPQDGRVEASGAIDHDPNRDRASMTPEQFIWTSVLKEHLGIDVATLDNAQLRRTHDCFVADNLIIMGPFEWRLLMWPGFSTSRFHPRYLSQYSYDECKRLSEAVTEGRRPAPSLADAAKGIGAPLFQSYLHARQLAKRALGRS